MLKVPLERYFCEEIEEMPEECSFDFKAPTFWLEIKGREARYRSDDRYAEKGWWIGYPKVLACKGEKQMDVYFIYYFESDKTTWLLKYEKGLFDRFVPFANAQGQLTIAVPKSYWTQISLQLSSP